MSEFRAALRGVSTYLLFGVFASMVAFAIADLVYPAPKWAPAAYVLLTFLPGLAAGLAARGGWKRGLLAGVLGAATSVLLLLLTFALFLAVGGRPWTGDWQAYGVLALLALASAASGAVGGELQARRGRQLSTMGSAISRALGTDHPRPAMPRWLTILTWTVLILVFAGVNILPFLSNANLPPQVLEWAPAVAIALVVVVSAVVRWRARKRAG